MQQTKSYTYFSIASKGEIVDGIGLVARPDGIFDPDEITGILGIEPFNQWRAGEPRANGRSVYRFSSWEAEKSDGSGFGSQFGRLDIQAQCQETISFLKTKIPELNQIRSLYAVDFCLVVVMEIYGDEQPWLGFNQEIIGFCHRTGTEISCDMHSHPAGE